MAKRTQGTQLYIIDPDSLEVLEVDCVINIEGIDTSNEQLDSTCLRDLARTFMAGLATPGQATFGINIDPSEPSHIRLHQLKVAKADLHFAVGWSDGIDIEPTIDSNGEFDHPPTTRSWIIFDGNIQSFPFTFAQNALVTSNVSVQVSGEPLLFAKAA